MAGQTRLGSVAVPADFVQRCMRTARSGSIVLRWPWGPARHWNGWRPMTAGWLASAIS